jgi:hypothetical protein
VEPWTRTRRCQWYALAAGQGRARPPVYQQGCRRAPLAKCHAGPPGPQCQLEAPGPSPSRTRSPSRPAPPGRSLAGPGPRPVKAGSPCKLAATGHRQPGPGSGSPQAIVSQLEASPQTIFQVGTYCCAAAYTLILHKSQRHSNALRRQHFSESLRPSLREAMGPRTRCACPNQ